MEKEKQSSIPKTSVVEATGSADQDPLKAIPAGAKEGQTARDPMDPGDEKTEKLELPTDNAHRPGDIPSDLEHGKQPGSVKHDTDMPDISDKDRQEDGGDMVKDAESEIQDNHERPEPGTEPQNEKENQKEKAAAVKAEDEPKDTGAADAAVEANGKNGKKQNQIPNTGNFSKLVLSTAFLVVTISLFLIYNNLWKSKSVNEPKEYSDLKTEKSLSVPAQTESAPEPPDPNDVYQNKLLEVAGLRETLLLKKEEVQKLKKQYRKAVEASENEIVYEMLSKGLRDYPQALDNQRIELALRTIQRRLAYIQKLDEPIRWLDYGSEELLYLKRKAGFDLQMIAIAGGINMDEHMRRLNAAIEKYRRLMAEELVISMESASLKPLENIWKELLVKTQNNPELRSGESNWLIQQEICDGNSTRIGELSAISVETAQCLAEMKTSDLFLNGLTELSPTAAEQLCQWKGKWICLNGIRVLSPAAAQYLFQWHGEWISLNGLPEFPPEPAKHLLTWKGKQLELMGLKYSENNIARIAFKELAQWEKSGGKLFVPDIIRRKMNTN